MKKTLAGMAILLLLFVGALWYSRVAAEQTLNDIAGYIDAFPGYSATPTLVEHELFSSRATLNLKIDPTMITRDMDPVDQERFSEQLAYLEQGLNVNLDIHRGPLVFHEGVYPGLYKVVATLDDDISLLDEFMGADFSLNDYFSFVVSMNYFGEGVVNFSIVELNRNIGDTRLEWAGMDHEYQLSAYGRSYAVDGVVHPLVVSGDDQRLETSALTISGEGDFPPAGTFIADARVGMDLAFVSAHEAGAEIFRLDDLNIAFDSNTDGETFSMNYGIGTGSVTGSALPEAINQLRFDFGINEMSVQGFNTFYNTAVDIDANADPLQSQTLIIQALGSLMEGNPEFLLKELSFSMGADKELSLSSRMRFGENFMTNASMAMMNPALLLNTLELEITASFTQPVLEMLLQAYAQNQLAGLELDPQSMQMMLSQQMVQMNAMILQAVQNGFLVQNGDRFELTAKLAGGAATVNGMAVPIPMMQ